MRKSSMCIVAVTALAFCGSPNEPPRVSERGSGNVLACLREERPFPSPRFDGCPDWLCGNTAKIYGDYIEALDERGAEVQSFPEPFRLVRGSLTDAKGGCTGLSTLSLGVRDGDFVGLEGPLDAVKCSGNELVGARFQVEQVVIAPKTTRFATVRINSRGDVAVWHYEAGEPARIPTYDLITERGPVLPFEEHLCSEGVWDSAVVNPPPDTGTPTRHAILVRGETYSSAATVVHKGDNWFNIGCAGSAVAKLRLLGFDPIRQRPATGDRQATLKMITAKYCGARSWTRNGTLVLIQNNAISRLLPLPGPGGPTIGPIEARWGPDGALCVSHSRLWSIGSKCERESESVFIASIRSTCGIPACEQTAACESSAARGDGVWRTCTVNHTLSEH